jgi:hypothetical protein
MEIKYIFDVFKTEFSALIERFDYIDLAGVAIRESQDPRIARAGVYIFYKDGEVLKVGKSLSNARRRALEDFRDNTGKIMKNLDGDSGLHLLLFTVDKRENEHWIIVLEDFFEWKLELKFRSGKNVE